VGLGGFCVCGEAYFLKYGYAGFCKYDCLGWGGSPGFEVC